jgi:hypothetical protein
MKICVAGISALLALVILGAQEPADAAGKPRLYLSWHAPYGAPRASDTLWIRSGDGGKDTLYLTFESAEDWRQFYGLVATIFFRTAVGDSLADPWLEEKNLETNLMTDSIPGVRRLWRGTQSTRYSFYDFSRGSGRLRLSNVRSPVSAVPIAKDVPYLFARVMVAHPASGVPFWNQPICVQWSDAEFLPDSSGGITVHAGREGRPFVSMNSAGQVCEAFRPDAPPSPAVTTAKKKPAKVKKSRSK